MSAVELAFETDITVARHAVHELDTMARQVGFTELGLEQFRRRLNKVNVALGIHADTNDSPAKSDINLRPLGDIVADRREPEWALYEILERNVLAVLAGARGTFKSLIGLDWMMRAALDGLGVVILSGEGGGLDRRADAWMNVHAPDKDITALPIVALEKPLNLNRAETRAMVAAAMAALPWKPAVILIDTLSKFSPGLKENDSDAVSAFLSGLTADLRDEIGCTVLLVAHSGHADAGRPRGSSVLMCNPDAEYIVSRPNPMDMTVTVSRDRFKDTANLSPLAYTARSVDLGRLDKYGQPVTSLVLEPTDPPFMPVRSRKLQANQNRACGALREWARAHPGGDLISTIGLRELLAAQGVDRRRRPEVIGWLAVQRILTPSIDGYAFDAKALP
jgi:AAA domain